ncbi:MAG: hypothetical protein HKN93_00720 [Acidimicrobiia bacterium]|nr:hypothetical protein [Acidimicrobiia bacterium]
MIAALVVAAGLAAGSWSVVVAGVLVAAPVPVVAIATCGWAVWSWRRRARSADASDVAVLAAGIASELRSGQSMLSALESASHRVPAVDLLRPLRLASVGRSSSQVAAALEAAVPAMGGEFAAAYRLGAESGARSSAVFGRLAVAAGDAVELGRDVRVSSAQARASAVVVALAPVVLIGVMGATGMLTPLWATGGIGIGLAAVGVSLISMGIGAVWWLSRRYLP